MKYVYSFKNEQQLVVNNASKILPENIKIFKENDKFLLSIDLPANSSEDQARYFIDRELTRIFFFTGQSPEAKLEYVEQDGKKEYSISFETAWNIYNHVPEGIAVQKWTESLPLQLYIWRIASAPNTPLQSVVNLLFQIIEASCTDKDFPEYSDSSIAPDPKTECKLLRHLVSHQGSVNGKQLKKYCEYTGFPDAFFDPTDSTFYKFIQSKVPLIKAEARKIISARTETPVFCFWGQKFQQKAPLTKENLLKILRPLNFAIHYSIIFLKY